MEVEGIEIDLPPLSSNPFSTLPLEASQSHLLVGRVHQKNAMLQYIRFKSVRRVLLSGEMGSGRSSLLRCLSNHAPTSVHIDHISHQNPALGLLREAYFQLTGTEAPTGWSQVVQKLVDASRAHNQSLPLIVIDAQGVEMNLLTQALTSAGAALNRVQCVLVVVIETMQKAQFPDQLHHMFDSNHHLEPFTIDEVQALVESRVKSVSNEEFLLSVEDARHLRDKSHGNPGRIIRTLRNAVDASLNPSSLAGIDRILSLDAPPIVPSFQPMDDGALLEEEAVSNPIAESNPALGGYEEKEHEEEDAGVIVAPEPIQSIDEGNGEILDASTPWTERQSMRDVEDDVKILDNMLGFELNLEQLDEQISTDEELPEIPFKALPQTPEFVAAVADPGPPAISGMFSSIVGRIRDAHAAPVDEEDSGTELWIAGNPQDAFSGLPPLEEETIDPPVEPSAELIHDEVGFFEAQEEEVFVENTELSNMDYVPFHSPAPLDESPAQLATLTQAVQALVSAISNGGQTNTLASQRGFIDALAGLQHKPVTNHEEHPLDVALLSNLNANEMAVLAVAEQRKYSPSDKTLLADLNVKRSRLSQISSRLLKGGVLNARTVGRSRFYTMTSTAKAQLKVWGAKGGEA